jgi:hypothetical protein
MVPLPPPEATDVDPGETLNSHFTGDGSTIVVEAPQPF